MRVDQAGQIRVRCHVVSGSSRLELSLTSTWHPSQHQPGPVVSLVRVQHPHSNFTSSDLLNSQEIVHGQFEINLSILFRKYFDIDVTNHLVKQGRVSVRCNCCCQLILFVMWSITFFITFTITSRDVLKQNPWILKYIQFDGKSSLMETATLIKVTVEIKVDPGQWRLESIESRLSTVRIIDSGKYRISSEVSQVWPAQTR